MVETDLKPVFEKLKKLLKKHAGGLAVKSGLIGSMSKEKKPALHLLGKKEVSIAGRKAQQTYIAGIVLQKSNVGFYFMPIYSHPEAFSLSPAMSKRQKGKSCFHIKDAGAETAGELDAMLAEGIALYKEKGWI